MYRPKVVSVGINKSCVVESEVRVCVWERERGGLQTKMYFLSGVITGRKEGSSV